MKLLLICFLALSSLIAESQVQCTIDVVINEGSTLEMCKTALLPISASNGFVSYAWSGPVNGVGQTFIPSVSGQYILEAVDGLGCISSDTINIIIHQPPIDAIISSAGDTLCSVPTSTTLSLSGTYVLYNWGGGNTSPTLVASTTGQYSVDVADVFDCVTTFTYDLVVLDFAVDTSYGNICSAGSIVMTASGGSTYSWSTGETGNTIVVTPSADTNIIVTITDGSCVETISTLVFPSQNYIDFSLQDTFVVASNEDLLISGPAGFTSYSWSPGDQLIDTTGQIIHFSGTESQVLTLAAVHPDGCTLYWSTVVIVVNLVVPNGFSPNGDTYNDAFVIPELENVIGKLVVWNRWGDIVYQTDHYTNDWQGTCEGRLCIGKSEQLPEGTYFYQVDVKGVTKEGYVTLKRI